MPEGKRCFWSDDHLGCLNANSPKNQGILPEQVETEKALEIEEAHDVDVAPFVNERNRQILEIKRKTEEVGDEARDQYLLEHPIDSSTTLEVREKILAEADNAVGLAIQEHKNETENAKQNAN